MDLQTLLDGYSQQKLPFLALSTNLKSKRLKIDVQCPSQQQNGTSERSQSIEENSLIAAIIRLASAYSDSTDLLLVELPKEEKKEKISVARLKLDQNASRTEAIDKIKSSRKSCLTCSFEDLIKASKEVGMNLQEGQSPSLITLGSQSFLQDNPEWYPFKGVSFIIDLEKASISIVGDSSIISIENATIFGNQIWQLYERMKIKPQEQFNLLDLPNEDLMSTYESEYDPEEAHLPIKWLQMNAKMRPNAIAHEICDEPESKTIRSLTFLELEERSNKLANWLLKSFKIQPGNPIGVMRKRDEQFYIAMAAIFKCRGCYLPIDQDLPKERKEYIIRDSNAVTVLTNSEGHQLDIDRKHCIDLENSSIQKEIQLSSSNPPNVQVKLDDLAYILYTSGTSGNPKGCLLMHRGLYWAIKTFTEIPKSITDSDNDKRLAMAAVAFDVHVSEIVQAWSLGIRLVSISDRMSLLANLQGTIENFGITHIGMVPSMIEATLMKSPSELPLKYITSGGEKINDNVLRTWAANSKVLFANLYGPTEATIGCTASIIRGINEPKEDIGYAFVGSSAYIVDKDLNIVPKGVSGELIIEGPLVAKGYINLPQATAKNFIEWPRKGCRAYRTGDLVRMNYDGSLSIHGRIDSQIKLRGVRIESEGVSAVISQASKDPKFDAVTVICKHESIGNAEMLITFITFKKDSNSANDRRGKPSLLELEDTKLMKSFRKASIEGLASYMRPSHIIPLTFFPLSHNGKVDTKPLVSLFAEASMSKLMKVQGLGNEEEDQNENIVKPANEVEEILVQSISEITGVNQTSISTKANMIEIGLNSMNCAKLTALIREKTGKKLSVSDILSCRTIVECAKMAENQKTSKSKWDSQMFQKDNFEIVQQSYSSTKIVGFYPPLPVQPGILFHIMQEKTGYVQHFNYRINEDKRFSIKDIKSAWIEVQKAFDILRTVFIIEDGSVIQVVLQPESCDLPFKFQEVDAGDLVKELNGLDETSIAINQDLRSPMFAITLFESTKEKVMTVSLSHTIYDAFAVRNIMTRFDQALSKRNSTSEKSLTMSALINQIYALPQQAHMTYWQETLGNALEQRKNTFWQPVRVKKGETPKRLNKMLDYSFDDVQKRCSQLGITIQTFFNVLFAFCSRSTIFSSSWQKYALFGNVRSGRNLPLNGIEEAGFPLVNVVPCLIDFTTKSNTIFDLMKSSHSSWISSIEHENVALSDVQAWLKTRDIVECLFSCRIESSVNRSNAYDTITHISTSNIDPEFPLAVEVLIDQTADTIELRIAHSPSAIPSEEIDKFLKEMEINIGKVMEGENIKVSLEKDGEVNFNSKSTNEIEKQAKDYNEEYLQIVRKSLAKFLKQDFDVIQPRTSLISLGMTSLRAVAFCHLLDKSEGMHLNPIDVVQGDNAISMAIILSNSVEEQGKRITHSEIQWELSEEELKDLGNVKLEQNDYINLAPCTPLQAGMLSQTVASDGKLYIHGFVMKLNQIDSHSITQILSVWSKLYAHFGILRTSFHFIPSSGQWIQAEHSPSSSALGIIQVDDVVDEDQARKRTMSKLNLRKEEDFSMPPIKMIFYKQSNLLVLALHHALYDGVSLANLFAIAKDAAMNNAPLPDTPSFLQISKEYNSSQDEAVSYWVERLKSVESNWFVKHRKIDSNSTKSWRGSIEFTQEEKMNVKGFNRRYKTSTQSLGQVAFAFTLNEFGSNHEDKIVFCQIVSGRTQKGANKVIGPTFNTIAIQIDLLGEDKKVKEIVQHVQFENNKSLKWQHAPLRNVQKALNKTSLSDALFLYQPVKSESEAESNEKNSPWKLITSTSEQGSTQFTLNLELHDSEDGLSVKASCVSDILSQDELNTILQIFKSKLLTIVQSPNLVLVPKKSAVKMNGNGHVNKESKVNGVSTGNLHLDQNLIKVLGEVLHTKSSLLKSDTNLSSIGLDSIAAMQISSRLRKQGNGNLTPMKILRCNTIDDLNQSFSEKVEKVMNVEESKANIFLIRPSKDVVESAMRNLDPKIAEYVDAYLPSAGMRYLFSGWQRTGGRQFQICIARQTEKGKRIDIEAMQKSWMRMTQRHVILRSTIVPSKDTKDPLVLFIIQQNHWKGLFDVIDNREQNLSTIDQQKSFAKQFGRKLLQNPPTIRSPSSRLTILNLPDFDTFFIQMPHTHYDAFTVPRLMNELWQDYFNPNNDENNQELNKDDSVEIQAYLNDSIIGNEQKDENLNDKRKEYWKHMLGEQHQSHIWVEDNSSIESMQEAAYKTVQYYIREHRQKTPKVKELQTFSQQHLLTPAAILTSTWAHVHAWQMQKSSSTFAFVHSGRFTESIELQETFCPTINLIPTFVKGLLPLNFDTEKDKKDLRNSIINTAQTLQKQWLEQPAWAIQSNMSDVSEWIQSKKDQQPSIFNTTLNVQIRPSSKHSSLRESLYDSKKERDSYWSPLPLQNGPSPPHGDRGWTQTELNEFHIQDLFLTDDGNVSDPSVRIDVRMVAAASHVENPSEIDDQKIVLEAEVANGILSRQTIDLALSQWAQLLYFIVN